MKFELTLPRDTKHKASNMIVNSNDRFHPQVKAKMIKRIRNFAYWHTLMTKDKERAAFSPSNPCEVTVTIYSPTKSRLDPPNLYPTVKAIIDGMTDAGIWVDDNHKVIKKMSFVYGGLSGEKGHYKLTFDIEKSKTRCLECGFECSDESSDYWNIQKTGMCIDCERDFIEYLEEAADDTKI